MKITLKPWTEDLKQDLIHICNTVNRTYLTNRLPDPYTEESADWWLNMVREKDGTEGLIRQGFVKNGQVYDYKILGKLKE